MFGAGGSETMKYLCLVHFDGRKLDAMTPEQHQELDRRSLGYDEELSAAGHFIHAEALQSPDTAALVKMRDGKMQVSDGPFAETKEQLGGYYLIEAKDLNEAIQIAARIPSAKIGSIEVRPIQEHGV
jgi:hypothetical protein